MTISPPLDQDGIRELIPHRGSALILERVTEAKPADYAIGFKTVREDDPFLEGHFPGQPVMPGVAIIECMAQLAGVLTHVTIPEEIQTGEIMLLGLDRARFRRPVLPGETLRLKVRIVHRRDPLWKFECVAWVGEEKAAEALIKAGLASRGKWVLSSVRTKGGGRK
jgi:3-hydroxyacyl-[acyl-carrier-protein] dehydratase